MLNLIRWLFYLTLTLTVLMVHMRFRTLLKTISIDRMLSHRTQTITIFSRFDFKLSKEVFYVTHLCCKLYFQNATRSCDCKLRLAATGYHNSGQHNPSTGIILMLLTESAG